ncbi:L-selectin [Folsomia candida]|uniref:L-selectin n=1 Tax=Folsomia candida TaxID=158441 RepID=A0A226F2S8_FOLCA|nr:L-selectin [Folsomia candida]OXA63788.1 L-selectin [Folsomia candida]
MKGLLLCLLLGNISTLVLSQCRGGNTVRWRDPRGVTHNYLFSWENAATRGQELEWGSAQATCRQYCMNLVSIETPGENNFIKQRIANARVRYIWTSGRKCNGCNLFNGWFWSGSGVRIGSANNRANGDWSHTGGAGIPQPDNRENTPGLAGFRRGNEESCLSILNNFYGDGLKWHDVACYHVKPFVCEG